MLSGTCYHKSTTMSSNFQRLCFSSLLVFILLDLAICEDITNIQAFYQGKCPEEMVCAHSCLTIDNGYICTCQEGYMLSMNGFSCLTIPGIEEPPVIDQVLHSGSSSSSSSDSISLSSSERLVIKSAGQIGKNVQTGRTDDQSNSLSQGNDHDDMALHTNDHITAEMFDLKEKSVKDTNSDVLHGVGEPLSLIHRPTCHGVVCQNNGTCVVEGSIVRCNCPIGSSGRRCEKQIVVRFPKFLGNGYLTLPVLKTGYKEFDIQIDFKPQANNGLLLFTAENTNTKSDFFSIALVNGYVEFRYDCGTGPAILRSKVQVTMGNWNRVHARRVDNEGSLRLNDGEMVVGFSKGAYSRITLRLPVYVGGYRNMTAMSSRIGITKPFVGCVQEIIINEYRYDLRKQELVGDTMYGLNVGECSEGICNQVQCARGGTCVAKSADQHICMCPLGTGGENCQYEINVRIPEFGGHSYLQHNGLGRSTLSYTQIEIVFKPTSREGTLLYNGFTLDRKGDFLSLAMKEGHLEFCFDLGTGPGVIRSVEELSLGQWHWVRVSRTGLRGVMEVDEQPRVEGVSQGAFTQLTLLQDLYIGGHSNYDHTSRLANLTTSFQGCIQKVIINEQPLQLLEDASHGVNIEGCEHPCLGEPCMNGGECVPDRDVYQCFCPLGYGNTNCEDEIEKNVYVPRYNGHSFLLYTGRSINKRVTGSKIDIQLTMKPERANGLILWSGRDQPITSNSDYLALGFVNGALQFRYNLGSGEAVISYNDTRLYDGEWHTVRAQRDKQDGFLEVDETEIVEGSSPGSYTMLNTNKMLYVGGMPNVSQNTLRKFTQGFDGCIASLMLAEDYDIRLVEEAQNGRNILPCRTES
ncbi:pikachurin-like [Pecten maximus]|uniref:pikachurin-like n=1 Tax=Pecten maximus TaxID=6579 RepID=UPI001458B3CB|nr:pikachurin-like [Pecten maximus]